MSEAQSLQAPNSNSETGQPYELSDELQARVDMLDLNETVEHAKENGYGLIRNPSSLEFNDRLREAILEVADGRRSANLLLGKHPIFAEVVMNPKILAMAEVLCGKGPLLSQLTCSVRGKGARALPLHADQNWTPAPFPVHYQLATFCWACDEFTKAGGATMVIPGTDAHRRHPDPDEVAEHKGAIATACPAGSIVFWNGSVWHGNWPRTIEGERVVLHMTFGRMSLRQIENYRFLDAAWLKDKPYAMRIILGREDGLSVSA